jgi:hypothetical protein
LFDLHTHTTYSDGTFTPEEIVAKALGKSLTAVAITDHDTTEGNKEAADAALSTDLQVIPGVEISTAWTTGILHILGYYVDSTHDLLSSRLAQLRNARRTRISTIVEKLRDLNILITEQDVYGYAGDGSPGRPHVANVLVDKGFVRTSQEAFDNYLAKGASAYVEKVKLEAHESISLIREAGGVAIMAHPYTLGYENPRALGDCLDQLKEMGLEGIEAYYPRHSHEQVMTYARLAKERGLMVTGGTDFHGANKPDIDLGVIPGHSPLPLTILEELRNRRRP